MITCGHNKFYGEYMSTVVNIVGAGRLGQTIGRLINLYKAGAVQAVCNSSMESSKSAITFIGSGYACEHIRDLPSADVTFITTPDDCIGSMAEDIVVHTNNKVGSTFIHCSGSLTSDILSPLFEEGYNVASCHPMRSFANPELSIAEFKGTYCAIEGSSQGKEIAESIFSAIGGITYNIKSDGKSLYHAAGVISSNYLVTLAHTASKCLTEAGVEHDTGLRIITSLMEGTISNLKKSLSPSASLTGPIARGDVDTISKHVHSLPEQTKGLYKCLGLSTLELTSHDSETISDLTRVLDENQPKKSNLRSESHTLSF